MKKWLLTALLALNTLSAATEEMSEDRRITQKEWIQENKIRAEEGKRGRMAAHPTYFRELFPFSDHSLFDINNTYDLVELEDGSRWSVDDRDCYLLTLWRPNDSLTLTRNHDWFGDCYYRLNNNLTGQSVRVNLVRSSLDSSPFTRYVIAVDVVHLQICLSDGSVWTVSTGNSSPDWGLAIRWQIFDKVIIGRNDGYNESRRPNILINCSTHSSVNAVWEY